MNFLPMALSKFYETFGLPDTEKGDFPIFFSDRDYEGEIPDINFFPIQKMNDTRLAKFKERHGQQKKAKKIFNYRNEIIKYCSHDVKILRQGCVKFMLDFINLTGINPLVESFTLAQAALLVYQKNFLIPKTLAITPLNNYQSKRNTSFIAQKWLIYENALSKHKIKVEVKLHDIPKIYVDGYVKETNTVYEFYGCFWHGCLKCFPNRTVKLVTPRQSGWAPNLDLRLEQTLMREQRMEDLGYKLVTKWECEFNDFLSKNPEQNIRLNNDSGFHMYILFYFLV